MTPAEYRALKPKKHGRYRVAPKEERTADGIVFDSKKEMNRYLELKLLERAGEITHLDLQPEYNVSINDEHFCRYRADFRYFDHGVQIIEDVKSQGGTSEDTAYKLRKKAAELFYRIKITEV